MPSLVPDRSRFPAEPSPHFLRCPPALVPVYHQGFRDHLDQVAGRILANRRNIRRDAFEMLAQGRLVSKAASEQMLSILRKQRVNNRFPRYLRGVPIAHKTGDGQPHIANDAGILWVNDQPIVLVVFTGRHRGTTAALHEAIARVAACVARHYGAALKEN